VTCDLISDLSRLVTHHGEAEGLPPDTARRLSVSVIVALQALYGGASHYVRAEDRAARDATILAGLQSGLTMTEVARTVGVHERTVRRVRDRRKRAGFGPAEWVL